MMLKGDRLGTRLITTPMSLRKFRLSPPIRIQTGLVGGALW
jgi:hypothetical protein